MSDENGKSKRTIPEISVETRLIFQRLSKAAIGEIITYKELSEIIHTDILACRYKLASAIRKVQNELQFVFAPVAGVGVKRLAEGEKIEVVEDGRDRLHRATRRVLRKAACVAVGELSKEDKTRFNVVVSQMAMLEHASKTSTTKKLTATVQEKDEQLPVGRVLELLK